MFFKSYAMEGLVFVFRNKRSSEVYQYMVTDNKKKKTALIYGVRQQGKETLLSSIINDINAIEI